MKKNKQGKKGQNDQHTDFVIIFNLFFLLLVGLTTLYSGETSYQQFVAEDGPAEWIATLSLLACGAVCIERAIKLRNDKSKKFILIHLMIAIVFFMGVGEELSWGQRILGIESSDFFLQNNQQKEINFHNLKFSGLNVNKLIFGTIMGTFIFFYLFGVTILFHKTEKVKVIVEKFGIPIPKVHHIIGIICAVIVINFITAEDKWELMELAGSMLFLAIIRYPENRETFLSKEEKLYMVESRTEASASRMIKVEDNNIHPMGNAPIH